MAHNTMAKRKRTTEQTMIYKTLYNKIQQHKSIKNGIEWISSSCSVVTSVVLEVALLHEHFTNKRKNVYLHLSASVLYHNETIFSSTFQ